MKMLKDFQIWVNNKLLSIQIWFLFQRVRKAVKKSPLLYGLLLNEIYIRVLRKNFGNAVCWGVLRQVYKTGDVNQIGHLLSKLEAEKKIKEEKERHEKIGQFIKEIPWDPNLVISMDEGQIQLDTRQDKFS